MSSAPIADAVSPGWTSKAPLQGDTEAPPRNIVFAITDWSTDRRTFGAFRDVFSPSTLPRMM